jgi:CarboxypepD_reg-like domain/TonB-dependent Receptor Plug Domain
MIKYALILCFFPLLTIAQNKGTLTGAISDRATAASIIGASVQIQGQPDKGTVSDSAGKFKLSGIPTGSYNVIVSAVGFSEEILFNVLITSGNDNVYNVELAPLALTLAEVKVVAGRTVRAATLSTPLSVQRLTSEEIKSNPGGNFDISRVIQSLPGVSGTDGSSGGFRNDIIIRGGAPSENVFYLDGIEVPVINHFSTQGSGGGPTGILNVLFIQDVKLSTSAFDARFDNTLSSVFQFTQKTGNPNRVQGNLRIKATDAALTLEGPISKKGKTTFLASARRSYLQYLFSLIDFPIRPAYWDFQTKITHKLDKKTTLTFIGIGAIDQFRFAQPKEATPEKVYLINNAPFIDQWNYTGGVGVKRQLNNGFVNIALSRDVLKNAIDKFDDNETGVESKRRLRIRSVEAENKLRADFNYTKGNWQWSYGASAQFLQFDNQYFNRYRVEARDTAGMVIQPAVIINSNTRLNFWRWGLFVQAGKRIFDDRLGINAGIRSDMNSFTRDGNNPVKTLSPRVALSFALSDQFKINASAGSYYKLPSYTILGFRDADNKLVNRPVLPIRSIHYVLGLEFLPSNTTRFTFETFYKKYGQYPVSIRDGISLANEGGDYSVVGNEAVSSTGKGKAYGIEFFAQQKLTKRFFGIVSYTLFKSVFSGLNGVYVPSAWDNRQLLSFTLGYKLPKNYELGLKFRYQGAAPFTPFDEAASRLNYLSTGTGVLDYEQVNDLRLFAFNQADIRIDKRWNFRNLTFDAFIEVTNFYLAKTPAYPSYTFKRNETNTGFLTTDGQVIRNDGSNAISLILKNGDAQFTPTIGFILEF